MRLGTETDRYIYYASVMYVMASLKKILYIIGSESPKDDKYMSVRDICSRFGEDEPNLFNRIRSQLHSQDNLFAVKRIGRNNFWKLNANGRKYLDKFKDSFDPISDRMLIESDKPKQIFRPVNKEVI